MSINTNTRKLLPLIVSFLISTAIPYAARAEYSIRSMRLTGISATLAHQKSGYRLKWKTNVLRSIGIVGFSQAIKPQIVVYTRNYSHPFQISSDKMKIDPVSKNFMLEGNVRVTTETGILKTHFLNFNAEQLEMKSFDKFIYQTPSKTMVGQGLYSKIPTQTMMLFGIPSPKKQRPIRVAF